MTSLKTVCPSCSKLNRVPVQRLDAGGQCGACHQPLFDGHPLGLNDSTFQDYLSREQLPIVVDFWADWCGPCKAMAPVFSASAAALKTTARFVKVDVEASPATAQRYAIRSIPTLKIFKNGQPIASKAGAMSAEQLHAWLGDHFRSVMNPSSAS